MNACVLINIVTDHCYLHLSRVIHIDLTVAKSNGLVLLGKSKLLFGKSYCSFANLLKKPSQINLAYKCANMLIRSTLY